MAQRTVATSTTAAIADPNQVPFTLRAIDFKHGRPRVSVEGIAGAETVSWWVFTNGDWEELDDGAGTQVAAGRRGRYASSVYCHIRLSYLQLSRHIRLYQRRHRRRDNC
jgi:hypothetical protein